MKRAKLSWHTKQNCMIRSMLEMVRRGIRDTLDRFDGTPVYPDTREEIALAIRDSLYRVMPPEVEVVRSVIDGDMLKVEITVQPPIYEIVLPEDIL